MEYFHKFSVTKPDKQDIKRVFFDATIKLVYLFSDEFPVSCEKYFWI